jgi:hypothetical protein
VVPLALCGPAGWSSAALSVAVVDESVSSAATVVAVVGGAADAFPRVARLMPPATTEPSRKAPTATFRVGVMVFSFLVASPIAR